MEIARCLACVFTLPPCDANVYPRRIMKILFRLRAGRIFYAYVGYAVWLKLLARLRRLPILSAYIKRPMFIPIAARNEEANLLAKLFNIRDLQYPVRQLQVIAASDGSTDQTAAILESHASTIACTFVVLNAAALAFYNFVAGRRRVCA